MDEDHVTRSENMDSLNRIHDRIDNGEKVVAEIRDCVKEQRAIVDIQTKNIDKLHSIMFGNGKDGLITKVSIIEKQDEKITLMYAAIFGSEKHDGLLAKIAALFTSINGNSRIIFLLATGFIGIAAFIIQQSFAK